jgi:hypothetical protein
MLGDCFWGEAKRLEVLSTQKEVKGNLFIRRRRPGDSNRKRSYAPGISNKIRTRSIK